jgi:hypothetical protein
MHRSLNKCKKKTNDNVYTPSDVVDDCMSLVDIGQFDTLLDPFYGDGAFYTKYPAINKKDWCEIEKGIDFFEYNKKVDWIISNPPFSKMTKVLNHCAEICEKGFGLIMLCFHLVPKRLNDLSDRGFKITKIHSFKVKEWFGFPCFFIVFSKTGESLLGLKAKQY